MTLSIRPATAADAARVAQFAARTFSDTYAAFNSPEDMAAHLSASYSATKQKNELADPAAAYLLAEEAGRLIGYGYVVLGHGPPGIPLDGPAELVRFYVASDWHGRGVAQVLMTACVADARCRGGRTLWLGVWQENPRAIAFYRKAGFRVVGTTSFRLGSQVQADHVMLLPLDGAGPAA
jgi:ribosomal protein S18 acetylase RimI-like enzyme